MTMRTGEGAGEGQERMRMPGLRRRRPARMPALVLACAGLLPAVAVQAAAAEAADAEVAAAAAEPAAPMPFLGGFITESRVLYPLRLGPWQAQGEHRYEDPAYGVSVRYLDAARAEQWLDVYFWPAGKLPPEALRGAMDGTVSELRELAGRPDYYDAIEVGEPEALELAPGEGEEQASLPAYLLPLRSLRQGTAYLSSFGLLVEGMYFVKLRYSAPAQDTTAAAVRAESVELLQALARQVRVTSTGACWGLLPAVVRAEPDAQAPDALMSSAVEGRVAAVAFADRVEARDPGDAAARLLQVAASLQVGRLADPSCVPPERIEPQVGDGQREIRLEYRRPSASPEPRRRLRVPVRRTG